MRATMFLAAVLLAAVACGGGSSDDSDPAGDADAGGSSEAGAAGAGTDPGSAPDPSGDSSTTLPHELQLIVNLLEEEDPDRRVDALNQARKKGESARAILAQLRELSDDPDPDVRTTLVATLTTVAGEDAIGTLGPMLEEDESRFVRVEILNALTKLDTEEARSLLVAAIDSDDTGVRAEAIHLAGEKGYDSDEVIQKLEAALDDIDGAVIRAAIQALGQLYAVDSAEAIAQSVLDKDEGVRLNACVALGELGIQEDAVVYALFRGLDDESLGVRDAAYKALVDLVAPEDTFGYSPVEVDAETRGAAIEKWKQSWEQSKSSGTDG